MHTIAGIAILIGLLIGAYGCLLFMEGGKSDDEAVGDTLDMSGCLLMLVGIASLVSGCFWLAR